MFPGKYTKLSSSSLEPNVNETTFEISKNNNANVFYKYFSFVVNLLRNTVMPINDFGWGSPVEITSRDDIEFNFEYVPKIFIERELRSLNRNKTTGIDYFSAGLLKDVASEIAASLSFLIHSLLQTDILPSNWKMP